MLSFGQAIFLGAVQGISELFPVSSLGHSVILPALFRWGTDETNPDFLIFLVAVHLATAIVLFLFYWKEWMRIIGSLFTSIAERRIHNADAKVGWLLVVATIPAGIIGLLFQDKIREQFLSPLSAAFFLVLNGALLLVAQWMRRLPKAGAATIADLSWSKALLVGTMQALALIPGFSRTGASVSGGFLVGLSNEEALRFALLLAAPLIGAAALLKIPELFATGDTGFILATITGSLFAALFAWLSARYLTRYFKLEDRSLVPFALYCIVVGITVLFFLG